MCTSSLLPTVFLFTSFTRGGSSPPLPFHYFCLPSASYTLTTSRTMKPHKAVLQAMWLVPSLAGFGQILRIFLYPQGSSPFVYTASRPFTAAPPSTKQMSKYQSAGAVRDTRVIIWCYVLTGALGSIIPIESGCMQEGFCRYCEEAQGKPWVKSRIAVKPPDAIDGRGE